MKPPDHLSPESIEGYRSRRLAPQDLIVVTTHLENCVDCRARVLREGEESLLLVAIAPEHLTYEQLETLSRGESGPGYAENLEHVASCRMCAEELADLRQFRASLKSGTRAAAKSSTRGYWWSAGVLAAALLAFAGVRYMHSGSVAPRGEAPAAPVVAAARYEDIRGPVTLDANGVLQGLERLSAQDRDAVTVALQSGELPASADLRDVRRSRETQLGSEPGSAAPLAVESPLGTVVLSDHPIFHWTAGRNAQEFRVTVFDTDFNQVLASPPLRVAEWIADKPLRRGRTYIWSVSALVNGEAVTAPKAPAPEARFRVASEADAASLQGLATESDLAFALAAWRFGLRDDARKALQRFGERNPGSPEVARIASAMGLRL